MKLTEIKYDRVVSLLATGYMKHSDIALKVGVPISTVQNISAGRKKRPGRKRDDAGKSKVAGMDTFVKTVKEFYLDQNAPKGNVKHCINMAKNFLVANNKVSPAVFASQATQYAHVREAFDREKWLTLWKARRNQHAFQSNIPKMQGYDYWTLLEYMDFILLDNRQSDQWAARYNDKGRIVPVRPHTYSILELKTRDFLHTSFSTSAYTSKQVSMIVLKTVLDNGRPALGIMGDNGLEIVAQDNLLAWEAFWMREEIEQYRLGYGVPRFHNFYPGHLSPIISSMARTPTDFGKAVIERQFREIKERFDAVVSGFAYQGGTRLEVVSPTLNRTPTVHAEKNSWEAFEQRMTWFMEADEPLPSGLIPWRCLERPVALKSFAKETGLRPTIGEAVRHCMTTHTPIGIPPENYFAVLYHTLDKLKGKRIKKPGQVTFQHDRVERTFWCDSIDYTMQDKYVDVVLDPHEPYKVGIFCDGDFVGVGVDLMSQVNTERISVGAARRVAREFRNAVTKPIRRDAKAVQTHEHTFPELDPVNEIKAIQFDEDIPHSDTAGIDYDELDEDEQRLMDKVSKFIQ